MEEKIELSQVVAKALHDRGVQTKLSEAAINMLHGPEAEALYSELRAEGYPLMVDKRQYATISRCSISTIDNGIKHGYGICNYSKNGAAKNARILFNLIDISNYLSQTIKTA